MALTLTPVTSTQAVPAAGVASSTTSFSPAAGTWAYVTFGWMWSTAQTAPTFTVADSSAVAWGSVEVTNDGFVFVAQGTFAHFYATAPGAVTVKVTCNKTVTAGCLIQPYTTSGAAVSQAGAATAALSSAVSSSRCDVSLTPTVLGSRVIFAGELQDGSAITPDAGCSNVSSWDDSGLGDFVAAGQSTAATAALTSTVYGWTQSPVNANGWTAHAVEILPAAGGVLTRNLRQRRAVTAAGGGARSAGSFAR